MYFKTTKLVIGIMVALGFLYPLGGYWYLGVVVGAIIFGWGWKESYVAMQRRAEVPHHKIAGLILIAILVANVVKYFI